MGYEIEIKREFQVTKWSGGITKELAIYPKETKYSDRNFIWRLSTAKVDCETSTFTVLPNYKRVIMALDGELELNHEGHHKCHLKPFSKDYFKGSFNTTSFGLATDFNLMMTEDCQGDLDYLKLNVNESFIFHLDSKLALNVCALYCFKGEVKINQHYIYQGELALIYYEDNSDLKLFNLGKETVLIIANIQFNK